MKLPNRVRKATRFYEQSSSESSEAEVAAPRAKSRRVTPKTKRPPAAGRRGRSGSRETSSERDATPLPARKPKQAKGTAIVTAARDAKSKTTSPRKRRGRNSRDSSSEREPTPLAREPKAKGTTKRTPAAKSATTSPKPLPTDATPPTGVDREDDPATPPASVVQEPRRASPPAATPREDSTRPEVVVDAAAAAAAEPATAPRSRGGKRPRAAAAKPPATDAIPPFPPLEEPDSVTATTMPHVTHFILAWEHRLGIAYRLSSGVVGFTFRDGSACVFDPLVNRLQYVNRHKCGFTVSTVMGRVDIPAQIEKKVKVVMFVRRTFASMKKEDLCSDAPTVCLPGEGAGTVVHRASVDATGRSDNDYGPDDHVVRAWYLDSIVMAGACGGGADADLETSLAVAGPYTAADGGDGTAGRRFLLTRRASAYPKRTFYDSEADESVL